jgi:hypothetical protein
MRPLELCTVAWGMGLTRCAANPAFHSILTERLPALHARGQLAAPLLRQVWQGWLATLLWADEEGGAQGQGQAKPAEALRKACQAAWEEGLIEVRGGQGWGGGRARARALGRGEGCSCSAAGWWLRREAASCSNT